MPYQSFHISELFGNLNGEKTCGNIEVFFKNNHGDTKNTAIHGVYSVFLRVTVPQPALTKEGWFKKQKLPK